MKKPFFLVSVLALLLACASSFAQEVVVDQPNGTPIDERIVYNRQNTMHIGANSQGFQCGFRIGRIKDIYTVGFWEGEVASLHSLKELKLLSGYASWQARSFVYGKLNTVFVMRAGYGQERRIYGKPYWGGIEMWWFYEGGPSLALLKPYYYNVVVYKPDGSGNFIETLEERRFDEQDQWMEIIGRGNFFKGFDQLSVSPGVHAKCGLSFDFGNSHSSVKALQCGVEAECYPLGVSIIDSQRDRRFFLTFFLSFSWGARFNQY